MHALYLSTHTDYHKYFIAWKVSFHILKEIAEDVFKIQGREADVLTAYYRLKLKKYNQLDPDQARLSLAPVLMIFKEEKVDCEIAEVLNYCEVRGKR